LTAQLKLEQHQESLINNQTALEIFQEISYRDGEAEVLKNLTKLHQALGEVEVARWYCKQALELATELGIPLAEECKKLKGELEEREASEGE
jgi:tetratricopeptide (TPR) repeat protein